MDILRTALETISKRAHAENLANIKTVWSNLEIFGATKIEAGSLDVGLLINTLYQSHKRAEILRESIRLLKKNGKLVIVEWKNIARTRDILIHHYFGVDYEIVWDIVIFHIPVLKEAIKQILAAS